MDPLFSLRRERWTISIPSGGIQEHKNTKTSRHSEIKQTRPSTKQDFSGEALSKQNTEASLASLSWNLSRAPTEWSAIFAFGVFVRGHYLFREANSFPRAKLEENCKLRGTDNVQGQISELIIHHIFLLARDWPKRVT